MGIVVGSKDVLLDNGMGKWGALNKYELIGVNVLGLLHSKNKEKLTFLLPDFGLAGALVVDGTTGRVVANGWTPASAIEPPLDHTARPGGIVPGRLLLGRIKIAAEFPLIF